jgi:Flp pilus assembly protein TadG
MLWEETASFQRERMGKIRIRGGRQGGQTLIIFAIAMPLFLSLVGLVVDGSSLMVHRRTLQVAADAAALAVAQSLSDPSADLPGLASDYSQKNGGPGGIQSCNDDPSKTNCYQTPYNGNAGLVEVRLTSHFTGFFASAIGLSNLFGVSARAVASATPVTGTTTTPGTPPSTQTITIPGGTHTTTDPGGEIGAGGIAFTLSRRCDAIDYGGAPKSAQPLGAFATNGGLNFRGAGNPKKVTTLYYDGQGCPKPSPSSGTSQCTSTFWGDASDSNQSCVKNLLDLNASVTLPINWPLGPPTAPTPQAGAFNPSTDYPSKCTSLGSSGTITFSTTGHPPGIYCVSGASTILVISTSADLTTGDGYTFFALDGAKIRYSSNGSKLWFYWPSACGPRPTTRPASFTCFGRTISGYDPQTVFYATNTTYDPTTCANNAICLNGQGNELTGDGFATYPDVFPPGPTDTGGTVFIAGGALAAGSGFFQSWMLEIQGNTGSYTGTGVPIPIAGQTHTTTDPDTYSTVTYPGTPPVTQTVTTGTTIGMDE